ncbi:MAG TPA: TlpA disulfide reductase family protein [Cyclobacteriaceae bacterium]|nr:TlpA disulfide reductase family protein [Cyclobacteriaceae bacterium]
MKSFLKSALIMIAVIIVLKMTGVMSSVSYYANAAIMKTGIMDATPGNNAEVTETLDYNFTIKTLAGEALDFNQFKGKVVFINLWATWCGPCRVEMPSIQELYNGLDKDKIQFVILSLDRNEDLPKIMKFVEKNQFTFPVYQPKGFLPALFQVPSIPTTFIIDKNGNVVSKKVVTTNFNTKKFKNYLEELAN